METTIKETELAGGPVAAAGFDQTKAEDFAGKMLSFINGGALALMTSIGHRTGLFDTIVRKHPPPQAQRDAKGAQSDDFK